ncbi:hypothetical protein [Burkholderia cenocepacia]|uniref:Uncharacterized protein n=1 Tax=Burkholderia cenocepacia TaxID=95486 RepID=A0A3Q9F8Q7_9BURK|nr:hypothetical protein [Burkholderia cenocepacia]AZQ52017.1 hypothetical protein D5R55_13920 [Burkholderia cenocepacia]
MSESLKDVTPDQTAELDKKSRAAYDAAIKSREALIAKKPDLKAAFDQSVHPQSLCGCGCQQYICGYFCFEGCGCGCGPHNETVYISSSVADIGPQPNQGTPVKFVGQATGTGTNIDLSNIYMQGTVPDAENLIGVLLTLELSINSGAVSMTILDGTRVLAVLVSGPWGSINGEFTGAGTGTFTQG